MAKHLFNDKPIKVKKNRFPVLIFIIAAGFFSSPVFQASALDNNQEDAKLLNDFIKSRGYSETIVFDATNIKRFWVDKSVLSKDGYIHIYLDNKTSQSFESIPLNVQLANVFETMDCRIDVITEEPDVSFSVVNNKSNVLSDVSESSDFINYHIFSSLFHLEDTNELSFSLVIKSPQKNSVSIKEIVLSFSDNKNSKYLLSPGAIEVTKKDVSVENATEKDSDHICVVGKQSLVKLNKRIIARDNPIKTSATVKNVGSNPTKVYLGYTIYAKNGDMLNGRNYPYKKDSSTLKVIRAEKGETAITVDSYSEWEKGCFVAIGAEDDYSDIPNTKIARGRIADFKETKDGKYEITIDKPLTETLKTGTKIRVHGLSGNHIYTAIKSIQPGEEVIMASGIQKDNDCIYYPSSKEEFEAIPKGGYCVVPLILSRSKEDNTIEISDFKIEY